MKVDKNYYVSEETVELLDKIGFGLRYRTITIDNKKVTVPTLRNQLPTLEETQRWFKEMSEACSKIEKEEDS